MAALFGFLGSVFAEYLRSKTAIKVSEQERQDRLHSSSAEAEFNIAQIADNRIKSAFEYMQKQINELTLANERKTERIAIDEERQRENMRKIEALEVHSDTCERVLSQTEKQLRFYDETLGVIRWEADSSGNLTYVNKHFLACTGLIPEEVIGDSNRWLEAIRDTDLKKVSEKWSQLISGDEDEIDLRFLFVNQSTQELTPVDANITATFGVAREIYKFTARTKSMVLINAELVNENRKLEAQYQEAVERNLQLVGRLQNESSSDGQ